MLFLSDAGIYLSTTRGSKLDIDIIIELEGIFYQMLNESKRWEKTEKIPIEIVQKIERLTTLSSSLVIKIKRGKDTEPEFFNVVLQLGDRKSTRLNSSHRP